MAIGLATPSARGDNKKKLSPRGDRGGFQKEDKGKGKSGKKFSQNRTKTSYFAVRDDPDDDDDNDDDDDSTVSYIGIRGDKRNRPPKEGAMQVDGAAGPSTGATSSAGATTYAADGAVPAPWQSTSTVPSTAAERCGKPCEAEGCFCEGVGACVGRTGAA